MAFYCPECGMKVLAEHQFCPNCGARLSQGNLKSSSQEAPKNKKKLFVILAVIFVILIGASLAAGLLFGKMANEQGPVNNAMEEGEGTTEDTQPDILPIAEDNTGEEAEEDEDKDNEEEAEEEEDDTEAAEIYSGNEAVYKPGETTAAGIVYFKDGDLHFYKEGHPYSYPLNLSTKAVISQLNGGSDDGSAFAMKHIVNTMQITDDESKLFYLDYKYKGAPYDNSSNFSLYMKDVSYDGLSRASTAEKGTLIKENVYHFTMSPDGTKVIYEYYDKNQKANCIGFLNLNSDLDKDFLVAVNTYWYTVSTDFTSVIYRVKNESTDAFEVFQKPLTPKAKGVMLHEEMVNFYYISDNHERMLYSQYNSDTKLQELVFREKGSVVYKKEGFSGTAFLSQDNTVIFTVPSGAKEDVYLYRLGSNTAKVIAESVHKLWDINSSGSLAFYSKKDNTDDENEILYMMDTVSMAESEIKEILRISDIKWHDYEGALYILEAYALSMYQPAQNKNPELYQYIASEVGEVAFKKDMPGIYLYIRNDGEYYYSGGNIVPGRSSDSFLEPTEGNFNYYVQLPSGFGKMEGDLIQLNIATMERRFLDDNVYHSENTKSLDLYYKDCHTEEVTLDDKNFYYIKDYNWDKKILSGLLYYQDESGNKKLIDDEVSFKVFPARFKDSRIYTDDSTMKLYTKMAANKAYY